MPAAGTKRSFKVVDGPRTHDEVRIAHISDLHFTTTTNPSDETWLALKLDLVEQRPHVIVATGDLIDNSVWEWFHDSGSTAALRAARQYLLELCKACELNPNQRLTVIPGNHDYRIKGNLISSAATRLFRETFANEFAHTLHADLGLLILAFDSNISRSPLALATGHVPVVDLLDAAETHRSLQQSNATHFKAWNDAVKVALLHHHPMPIAATEEARSLTEVQSFLLLRNAGRFMAQMIDENVDVILHGHRHYPAFSRATYDPGDGEHTVAVIAAGSVSHRELHHCSYNLITIEANGQIRATRRSLELNEYKKDRVWLVRDYRQARANRYARLLAESGGRLHAERYSRHDVIQRDSGDDHITESFEGVTSLTDEPVARISSRTLSRSGYFGRVHYIAEGAQRVTWERQAPQPDGSRVAVTTFDPPIAKAPVTYQRSAVFANAIYFSSQDRMDATANESSEESIRSSTIHGYENVMLSVTFPEDVFPESPRVAAMRPDGTPDDDEQRFVSPHMVIIPHVRTVTFSMERPLPGYEYRIVWDLPPDTAPGGTARDAGDTMAVMDALAGTTPRLTQLLSELAAEIGPSVAADLFVYRHEAGGQCRTASSEAAAKPVDCVRSGVGAVGRAYRRRALIATIPILHGGGPLPGYLADELAPFDATVRMIVAVPIYYPLYSGRRIGTIVFRTNGNSPALGVWNEPAWQLAMHDRVQTWYIAAIAELANVAANVRTLPDVDPAAFAGLMVETELSDITKSWRIAQHKPMKGSLEAILDALGTRPVTA